MPKESQKYKNVTDRVASATWVEHSGQPPVVIRAEPGEIVEGPGGAYLDAIPVLSFGAIVPIERADAAEAEFKRAKAAAAAKAKAEAKPREPATTEKDKSEPDKK